MGLFAGRRTEMGGREQYQHIPPAAKPAPSNSVSSRAEIPISNELMAKHEESLHRFPRIHLSRGEFVIVEVRRHPIGLFSIWALVGFVVAATLLIAPFYALNRGSIASILVVNEARLPAADAVAILCLGLGLLFVLGGMIATFVYNGNLFYLTNESLLQFIQTSIFSTREQIINLVNIDDVSYRQKGIIQQVLNYGTLRVSTEGDERNPYVFYFVARPQQVVRTINDAMEEATGFAVRYRAHRNNIDTTLPPPSQF